MSYKVTVLLVLGLFGLVSYLLGSINFAIIVTKIFTGRDIRRSGSGNAGMTNVMRIVGFLPGAITLLFDVGKAVLATCLGKYFMFDFLMAVYPKLPEMMSAEGFAYASAVLPVYAANICGFFCILGHLYPVYFKFKGGKEFPPLPVPWPYSTGAFFSLCSAYSSYSTFFSALYRFRRWCRR